MRRRAGGARATPPLPCRSRSRTRCSSRSFSRRTVCTPMSAGPCLCTCRRRQCTTCSRGCRMTCTRTTRWLIRRWRMCRAAWGRGLRLRTSMGRTTTITTRTAMRLPGWGRWRQCRHRRRPITTPITTTTSGSSHRSTVLSRRSRSAMATVPLRARSLRARMSTSRRAICPLAAWAPSAVSWSGPRCSLAAGWASLSSFAASKMRTTKTTSSPCPLAAQLRSRSRPRAISRSPTCRRRQSSASAASFSHATAVASVSTSGKCRWRLRRQGWAMAPAVRRPTVRC
mmetsp:Transcript_31750/g.82182  ORF Transcript_31750/g.82182 Transcript_31750/m.82182 type:complete len:284 (+) Transcript_31750:1135-1986(+)